MLPVLCIFGLLFTPSQQPFLLLPDRVFFVLAVAVRTVIPDSPAGPWPVRLFSVP